MDWNKREVYTHTHRTAEPSRDAMCVTSDLQVKSRSRFRELTEEVVVKAAAQDVLSVCLVGVKGQLLKSANTPELINDTRHARCDLYCYSSSENKRTRVQKDTGSGGVKRSGTADRRVLSN